MTARAPANVAGWWTQARWRAALLLLVIATVAIRARYFGDPFVDVDEEFYLLTGDRLLHGALPYVDIWDRKPVGLFLLYAAMRLLGGDGIVQYQLVASGFAAATAVMIAILARRIATPGAALVAALAYVPALAMNGGQGGQTPVFYNLPMAVAAWLLIGLAAPASRGVPREGAIVRRGTIVRRGALAMLLVGIAMQIKYSAVFEGLFFGLALVWLGWRARMRPVMLVGAAAAWAALALLPTAAAWAWYAGIGHGADFVYANFTSIAARGAIDRGQAMRDLARILIRLQPFLIAILFGEWLFRPQAPWHRDGAARAAHAFIVGWLSAALFGFWIFGSYFNHYALPLLPPLCIAAAPLFAIRARAVGPVIAALTLAVTFVAYPLDARKHARRHGDAAYARRIAAAIAPRLHGGCLYVFYGEPILYQLTGSCLPTRWPFPFHLSLARESGALGVDPMAELERIMATRPPVVVDRLTDDADVNAAVQARLRTILHARYRLVFQASRPSADGIDTDMVWALPDRVGMNGWDGSRAGGAFPVAAPHS